MEILHENRLSCIPIKTADGNGQTFLICDRNSRFISAQTVPDGKIVAKFRSMKSYMNENYQKVICQLNDSTFVFSNTQYYGSWKNDLRLNEHSYVVHDFKTKQQSVISCSVLDLKVVSMNNGLILVDTKSFPNKRWKIFRFEKDDSNQLLIKEYAFLEPMTVQDHYACYLSPFDKTMDYSMVLYFNQKPGQSIPIDKIALVKLDDNLLMTEGKQHEIAPLVWQKCNPDSQHGSPTGHMLQNNNIKLFCQKGNVLCFGDVKVRRCHTIQKKVCLGLWLLIFEQNNEPRWKKITFKNDHIVNDDSIMVINDENEIYLVEPRPDQEIRLTFLTNLKVPHLKHLGAKAVVSQNPNLAQMTIDEQIRSGLPKGCLVSSPWLNNFAESSFTDDEMRSIVVCNLTSKEFHAFCTKRLNHDTVIESMNSNTERRHTVIFKTFEDKEHFLKVAKSVEDDRYTNQIVEIYDYCKAYKSNEDPIFISIPGDMIL